MDRQPLTCIAEIDDDVTDAGAKPEEMIGVIEKCHWRYGIELSERQHRNHVFTVYVQHNQIMATCQVSKIECSTQAIPWLQIQAMNGAAGTRNRVRDISGNIAVVAR
jgi:hypothetical protein